MEDRPLTTGVVPFQGSENRQRFNLNNTQQLIGTQHHLPCSDYNIVNPLKIPQVSRITVTYEAGKKAQEITVHLQHDLGRLFSFTFASGFGGDSFGNFFSGCTITANGNHDAGDSCKRPGDLVKCSIL